MSSITDLTISDEDRAKAELEATKVKTNEIQEIKQKLTEESKKRETSDKTLANLIEKYFPKVTEDQPKDTNE